MEPGIIVFLVFGLFLIGVPLIIVFTIVRTLNKRDRTDHMRLLGEQLGVPVSGGEPFFPSIEWLSFIKKPTRVSGDYRGGQLEIWHFTRGSGKNSSPYIGMRLGLDNPRGLSFKFHKEGFFSKIGKKLGMEDVQVGDSRFDKEFIVKCSDPDFIRTALLPEIKERFYHAFDEHGAAGTIELREMELYYEEGGRIRSDELRARFAALIDLCADLRETVYVYNDGL